MKLDHYLHAGLDSDDISATDAGVSRKRRTDDKEKRGG